MHTPDWMTENLTAEEIESLAHPLDAALTRATLYRRDPHDFPTAWRFLDGHPAFWVRLPDGIQTNGAMNEAALMWYDTNKDGTPTMSLETGEHVLTDYKDGDTHGFRYHDYLLDSDAETFESAVIEMAQKVDHYYDGDGQPHTELKEEAYNTISDGWRSLSDTEDEEEDGPILSEAPEKPAPAPLPPGIAKHVPAPRPCAVLHRVGENGGRVVMPNGEELTYDTLEEGYDAHEDPEGDIDLAFSEELQEEGLVFVPRAKTSRLLMLISDSEHIEMIEDRVGWFNRHRDDFREKRTLLGALDLIDSHPDLWVKANTLRLPYSWESEMLYGRGFRVTLGDDDKVVVSVFRRDPEDPTKREQAPSIVKRAFTFEEAILEAADALLENEPV